LVHALFIDQPFLLPKRRPHAATALAPARLLLPIAIFLN